MQNSPNASSWGLEPQSQENSAAWPALQTSPPKCRTSPKPAHLAQSSSPSFLQAYAKYVEQKRDAVRARQPSEANSPTGQTILAFTLDEPDSLADALSSDMQKEATDSIYSSWPASFSTVSPGVWNTRMSAESLPSPTPHTASRFRQEEAAGLKGQQRRADSQTTEPPLSSRGTVAAAVDALETRFRVSSQEPSTPRKSHTLLSIHDGGDGLEKLQTSSAPSSPWPRVHYEPSPRRKYSVEVCVVPSANDSTPRDGTDGGLVRNPTARTWQNRRLSGRDLDAKLSGIFDQQPLLREELLKLLQEPSGDADESLVVQVQDLMRSYPDLVDTLNAQFGPAAGKGSGLRQALLTTASMRLPDANEPRRTPPAEQKESRLLVSRGPQAAASGDVQEDGCEAHNRRSGRRTEISKWLVPPHAKRYFPWSTCAFTAIVLCIFFFMAGSYASFLLQQQGAQPVPQPYLPSEMGTWLHFSPGWRSFDFDYLLLWGGQYLPSIHENQDWRWISAVFVHASFMHLLGNMLLFAVLGGILERRYGAIRMLLVLLLSALGAAFFSGAFADQCTLVVGASGAVLGLVGLTVADLVVNFGDLRSALPRLVITAAAIIFFIVTAVSKAGEYTSNWSHLGGFVCGLFPSFLFLPDLKDQRWRKAKRLAAKLQTVRHRRGLSSATRQNLREARNPVRVQEGDPESILSPHPLRSQGWFDGLQEANSASGERVASGPLRGGVALPGMTRHCAAPRTQNASPNGSDHQPGSRLFTEDPSDGAYLGAAAHLRQQTVMARLRVWLCPWSCAVLPCVVLGAFVIVGVFSALPTYIYTVRLPGLQCPSP